MENSKKREVLTIYVCFILAIAIVTYVSNLMDYNALLSLSIGTVSSVVNFFLLIGFVKSLTKERFVIAVQIYILRLLIYLLAAFYAVKGGMIGAIVFSSTIIAISLSIFMAEIIGIKRDKTN